MNIFDRQIKDIKNCEYGALQYQLGKYDVIEIKCFNKNDAQWHKDYMKRNYPNIPLRVTWLEWN